MTFYRFHTLTNPVTVACGFYRIYTKIGVSPVEGADTEKHSKRWHRNHIAKSEFAIIMTVWLLNFLCHFTDIYFMLFMSRVFRHFIGFWTCFQTWNLEHYSPLFSPLQKNPRAQFLWQYSLNRFIIEPLFMSALTLSRIVDFRTTWTLYAQVYHVKIQTELAWPTFCKQCYFCVRKHRNPIFKCSIFMFDFIDFQRVLCMKWIKFMFFMYLIHFSFYLKQELTEKYPLRFCEMVVYGSTKNLVFRCSCFHSECTQFGTNFALCFKMFKTVHDRWLKVYVQVYRQ